MYYKITGIIPAFNEEKTIGDIITVLKKVDLIEDIIVVNDGSTDKTAEISRGFGAEVIDLKKNMGKGGAVDAGVRETDSDIVLFLDADLLGLKQKHITDLLLPVILDECQMTIGVFEDGRKITDLGQKITPFLSGQRAMKRGIISDIKNIDVTRYGIELALTKYVSTNNVDYKEVPLSNLTHVMKEEKMGLMKGLTERVKMYWEVIKVLKFDEFSRKR